MDPRLHGPLNCLTVSEYQPIANLSNGIISPSCTDHGSSNRDASGQILRYIDQVLMEESTENEAYALQESLDLQAKERSFYEVLDLNYPPSSSSCRDHGTSNRDASGQILRYIDQVTMDESTENLQANGRPFHEVFGQNYTYSSNVVDRETDPCFHGPSNSLGITEYQVMAEFSNDINPSSSDILNFVSGSQVFELSKFIPSGGEKPCVDDEQKQKWLHRGKKNCHTDGENDCQGRSNKLPVVVYTESNAPVEEYDDILITRLCQVQITDSQNPPSGAKGVRITKQKKKKQVTDLESLLINCSQSIGAEDFPAANELLKQIRHHSSPFGNEKQRLAHYFADGIEGRLAGTDSQIYKALVYKDTNLSDCRKAYCDSLAFCPFRKISNFACNEVIMIKSEKAKTLHIIDFGVLYGFQWPSFIKRLGERQGHTPRLRITGIEFPQKDSQPVDRIEDTGRRLARYAKMFNVSFEYNAVTTHEWETIKVEDLKIEKGEFVAVNCIFQAMKVSDEEIARQSSRSMFFNLIRKINPDIFVHGINNGAYGGGTFVSRFLELLFHNSSLFDMMETIIPREKSERVVVEGIFGKEILNVIACEGRERIVRPETYKKWHKHHFKANFIPVPFERKLMDAITYKVRKFYHKEFSIHGDNQWMLMSWKGRIIIGVSCWKPVLEF